MQTITRTMDFHLLREKGFWRKLIIAKVKKLSFLIVCVFMIPGTFGQAPLSFKYQAALRNASGQLMVSAPVTIQLALLKGGIDGNSVYVETFNTTTNEFGLVNLDIGAGTVVSGNFESIEWGNDAYFIKVWLNDTEMGTSQVHSVPYALYSKKAETISESALTGNESVFDGWDKNASDDLQTLTIDNDVISLTGGGSVKLPDVVADVNISNDSLYIVYSHGNIINAGYIGNGSPGSYLPVVVTLSVSDTFYRSASVNAEITDQGNEFIFSRGFVLSANPAPDLNDTVYFSGQGSGSFIAGCDQLSSNTTYYVRAFATNSVGTQYGNELSFKTRSLTIPSISTKVISNITNTTAISGGIITDDGGSPVLERGICWSLNPAPTTSDHFITEITVEGDYITMMTGLTSDTLYYVRAYASNAQGISYGDELSFRTISYKLASVTTAAVSVFSYTTAMCGGNIIADNGSPVTSRGICWATTQNPTIDNTNYSEPGGLGTFSRGITGLTANTTYYVRAFAVNEGGTSYGNQISFTTLPLALASLTTKPVSGVSSYLAGSGGVINNDGGSAITAKGVCWSLNPGPTTANNKTTDGSGSESYNSTMTGLEPLTPYYVRAYATNALGTAYGNELPFTTTDLINPGPTVPIVGTSTSTMTGSTTASSGGYVSADGGSPVTARGICWSLNTNPTLADNFTVDGEGLGFFPSTITELSGCGIVYYVRAYATNSTGTGYGNQNTVSTGLLPAVSTNDAIEIHYYSAVFEGTVTDDGGCPVTQKGVCWSYNPNPTIGNPHTSEGPGSGTFTSDITGLYANRTYYVRAYATNSKGTVYGEEKVFTTEAPSTPYIGQNYAGGIVFYINETGEHGLVCAPTDQGIAAWGCQGTFISGTGTAIGTGILNTAGILASCTTPGIAAKVCEDLVLNGYNDWFLPSLDELNLIYQNLHIQGLGGYSTWDFYWSSSETNADNALGKNFYDGYVMNWVKNNPLRFRAVRAF